MSKLYPFSEEVIGTILTVILKTIRKKRTTHKITLNIIFQFLDKSEDK